MTAREPVAFSGAPGSPYTRKMLAVLRYRRIPYRFLATNAAVEGMPQPKVRLLPTFYLADEAGVLQAVTDSTPLIRRFEREVAGRSILPPDPATAFLDALIEDYADEWLTKCMFHYRWAFTDDIERAAAILPLWSKLSRSPEELAQMGKLFAERQIGRLYVVGSNRVTAPVIETSYRRFLEAFEALLMQQPFLMGERPGASDFAVYGQLTQLAAFDPTPMTLTLDIAPRVFAWTQLMDDQSGLEPDGQGWLSPDRLGGLRPLLGEIGRTYTPVMLANALALMSGAAQVEAVVEGLPWTQQPFPYQGKCLTWLRADYAALEPDAKARIDALLAGTGCEALFTT